MTKYTATPAKMHSGHDIRDERGSMVAIVHNPDWYAIIHNPKSDPADGARRAATMAASPALLAAARLALNYLETLDRKEINHPQTKAEDALHDAIVAAQCVPK